MKTLPAVLIIVCAYISGGCGDWSSPCDPKGSKYDENKCTETAASSPRNGSAASQSGDSPTTSSGTASDSNTQSTELFTITEWPIENLPGSDFRLLVCSESNSKILAPEGNSKKFVVWTVGDTGPIRESDLTPPSDPSVDTMGGIDAAGNYYRGSMPSFVGGYSLTILTADLVERGSFSPNLPNRAGTYGGGQIDGTTMLLGMTNYGFSAVFQIDIQTSDQTMIHLFSPSGLVGPTIEGALGVVKLTDGYWMLVKDLYGARYLVRYEGDGSASLKQGLSQFIPESDSPRGVCAMGSDTIWVITDSKFLKFQRSN
jgi:hypothetical protein